MSCGFIQAALARSKKPITPAPDICVQVYSPANELQELIEKRAAYFRAGAHEVWICDQTNSIQFFGLKGQLARSAICPKFPKKIELYPKEARARGQRAKSPQTPSREAARNPSREREQPER
jgi:Putative restriction endonuclease